MKQLRLTLSVIVLLLLAAGYIGSQVAYFQGTAPDWAARMDTPVIAALAMIVLVVAIVLSLVKDRSES